MNPLIVTLCGSIKFKQAFIDANFSETMAGNIVLSVGGFGHADHANITEKENKCLALYINGRSICQMRFLFSMSEATSEKARKAKLNMHGNAARA